MKNTLYILLCLIIIITGCSKTNTSSKSNSITINGKSYPTVKIGNLTWTALNYDGPGGTAMTNNNDEANIGKFYTLPELQTITLPSGWRIPTQADFIALLSSQGTVSDAGNGILRGDSLIIQHLRSVNEWGIPGDNKSGFNALPTGFYNAYANVFNMGGATATFWSSTPGTNTVTPPSQCLLELAGYHTSVGSGSLPNLFAFIDPTNGVLNLGYNLRFVKNN